MPRFLLSQCRINIYSPANPGIDSVLGDLQNDIQHFNICRIRFVFNYFSDLPALQLFKNNAGHTVLIQVKSNYKEK